MKVITKKEKNRCTFTLMDELADNWTDTFSLDFDTGIFYDSDNHERACPFVYASLNTKNTSIYFHNALVYIAAYPFLKKEERAVFCSYMERYAALDLRFNLDYIMNESSLYPNYSALCYMLQHIPIAYSSTSTIAQRYVEGLIDDLQKSFPNVPSIHIIVGQVATFWCMIGQPRAAYVSLIRFFLREKLHVFEKGTINSLMVNWMTVKYELNEPYDNCPSHGFAIELVEAKKRQKAEVVAATNEKLQRNNNLPYLYFEDETFICKPLLTCEAFHDEAIKQDNCVERIYLDVAAKGKTHVVSIRRKADPTSSCITCEIKNYEIIQYLQAHNKKDYKEDENAFREKLAAHLRAVNPDYQDCSYSITLTEDARLAVDLNAPPWTERVARPVEFT